MTVIDIRNPNNLQIVGRGTATTFGSAVGLTISGNFAYVASFSNNSTDHGLQIFDISEPTNPVQQPNFLEVLGRARGGIAISGNVVCFTSTASGLVTINVSDRANPILLSYREQQVQSNSIAVSGNNLYTLSKSSSHSQMYVYNISNPKLPTQIGSLGLVRPLSIALDGNGHAFVGDDKKIKVVDIHDPANPVIVKTIDLPDYAWNMTISQNKLFIANYNSGLLVYNISNPHNPTTAGTLPNTPGGVAVGVAVSNNTVVVTDITAVLVANITTSAVSLAKTLLTTTDASGVRIANGYAYVATDLGGIRVVDIRTPSNSQFVGNPVMTQFGAPRTVEISQNKLFVGYYDSNLYNNGLQVFNISTPTQPTSLGYLPSSDRYQISIAVADRFVYLTNYMNLVKVADLYYDYLKVEQTVNKASVMPNEEITYTLKVTNPTPYTLTGLNLSNPIPPEVQYLSSSPSGTISGGKVNWTNIGSIAPNETKTYTFTVRVL